MRILFLFLSTTCLVFSQQPIQKMDSIRLSEVTISAKKIFHLNYKVANHKITKIENKRNCWKVFS